LHAHGELFAKVFSLTPPKFKSDHIVSRIYSSVKLGEINMPAKYESHRASFARALRQKLHANKSAECRSCHSFLAMDLDTQDRSATKKAFVRTPRQDRPNLQRLP
jgi:nitrate/TMAO reductase-like tetraheme cytochrome c subunit